MRYGREIKFFLIVAATIFTFYYNPVRAASTTILISEVYYDAAKDKGDDNKGEWIELYNASAVSINLKDWTIKNNKSVRTISNSDLILPAKTFVLIMRDSEAATLWQLPPDLLLIEPKPWFGGSLANHGDHLILNDTTGNTIDAISWGDDESIFNLSGVKEGYSLERNDSIDNNSASDFVPRKKPTPGKFFSQTSYSAMITLTEIMPKPLDGAKNEFIEVKNNELIDVSLGGWQIDDEENGSKAFSLPPDLLIHPGQCLAIYHWLSGIALNDKGDTVRLLDPEGEIKNEVAFDSARSGKSFSKINNNWQWSEEITPGRENIPSAPTAVLAGSIEQIRTLADGQEIETAGTVTAPVGALSEQYLYIQDKNTAIQVYSYKKELPDLAAGSKIKAKGELSGENNDRRLKIKKSTSIETLSPPEPITPIEINSKTPGEEEEGLYIKIRGKVEDFDSDEIKILSAGGIIRIFFRQTIGFKKPSVSRGDEIEAAGIVSEYDGQYRLLPFLASDVKIISRIRPKPPPLPPAPEPTLPKAGMTDSLYDSYDSIGLFITLNCEIQLLCHISKFASAFRRRNVCVPKTKKSA